MRITALTLIFLGFLSSSFAKTIIVSDIDDTIKISHVRDSSDKIGYAFETECRFEGMSELYSSLLAEIPDSQIVYLTNAPKWLMKSSHTKLLNKGNFPQGKILFRSGDNQEEHKIKQLKRIIKEENPDQMILVGDNGQMDILFYDQIAKSYSDSIEFFQFIRIAYSPEDQEIVKLKPNQVGFITPIEMTLALRDFGLLEDSQAALLVNQIGNDILAEETTDRYQPQYFPDWLECRGFVWPAEKDEPLLPMVHRVFEKVAQICEM